MIKVVGVIYVIHPMETMPNNKLGAMEPREFS
jgi:hypothetical protein